MRNLVVSTVIASSALGFAAGLASTQALAETRAIKATADLTWLSNGKESQIDGTPIIVDNLQVGDIIDVQVAANDQHGFITIKQIADVPPEQNKNTELVLACGEDKAKKPNAVLRETECGAKSQFGQNFTGSMKLEVLSTFTNDVNFWCTEHFFMMTGKLKLKPKA
jgi:hypothetical protein